MAHAVEDIRPVVEGVRDRGAAAVLEATARFDGVTLTELRVPAEALAAAVGRLDPDVRAAIEESIRRHRELCTAQLRDEVVVGVVDGGTVTERWYPSSVVMNVVPALVAGVQSLAVTSPPKADFGGLPDPQILAVCALLGVEEVYAVGGAQAIAMLAYGVEGVPPVDVITGRCGIDSEAGPTEIAVLADSTAHPAHVASDLISQAEHDPLAACLLVTDSPDLADAVDAEVAKQVAATKHKERITAALTGQSATVLVEDLDHGVEVVDAWAAEHLEVITADAAARARQIRNAGAVFVGGWTPVSLGDYLAGSNHVLPTGGTARFSAGLSTQSFLKRMSFVEYSQEALEKAAPLVTAFAHAEDLPAHAAAVNVRSLP